MPGGANNDVNVYAEGNTREPGSIARASAGCGRRPVDGHEQLGGGGGSALYPTIGVGFRYGETPEIFSVASPTSGLMFSNDVLPVKVRWFFACGPMDFRGLYKANVT